MRREGFSPSRAPIMRGRHQRPAGRLAQCAYNLVTWAMPRRLKGSVNSDEAIMTETVEQRQERNQRRRDAVRRYADGELSWSDLKRMGVRRYTEVMADLADMGLRLPVAPLEGESAAMRQAGIIRLEEALRIR